MHIYPCDAILDVWAKHPFVAIFCGRKKTKQNNTKQRETNKEGKKKKKHKSMLVNKKNRTKTMPTSVNAHDLVIDLMGT